MQSEGIAITVFSFGWTYKTVTPKLLIFQRMRIISDTRNVD